MSAAGRNLVPQPTRPLPIDWRNPHARDLVLATYAEEQNIFRNLVDGKLATEGGGSPAFNVQTITQWGRSKATRGSSYANRWLLNPLTPVGHRGKMTVLVLCSPRVANGTATRYVVSGGENSGGWAMARVGAITGDYFIGSCVNGAVLQSDAPYTLGNFYAVAFTNYATATPVAVGRQRLYVNGIKQAAEGSYASNNSKSIDYLTIGSALANHWDIYGVFVWARELTANEVAEISANPYQLLAQRRSMLKLGASAPVSPSPISVGTAHSQLAGGDVSMRVSRRVAVQATQLQLAGVGVAFQASRRIGLRPASLTVSGGQAGVTAVRRMAATPASQLLQPGAGHMRVARRLAVAPTAAALVGGTIEFVHTPAEGGSGYSILVSPAALALTGGNVTMRVTRKIAAAPAVLTLAVGDVRLRAARRIGISPAALQATAGQVLLRVARCLPVAPAQLVMVGGTVTLRYSSEVEYARAPAGAGYSPQRVEVQSRPVQSGGYRPVSIQRNRR